MNAHYSIVVQADFVLSFLLFLQAILVMNCVSRLIYIDSEFDNKTRKNTCTIV